MASHGKTVNRNLEIKNLPIETDRMLNTLASLRGMSKRDLVREALIEFVSNHKGELQGLIQ